MATFSIGMPWNEGESQMHKLMNPNIAGRDNPTATILTPQAVFRLRQAPLLAIGTLDSQNRPWTTLWGGNHGFSEALGGGLIGTRTHVDAVNDPVVQALVGGATNGDMVNGNEKMLSGLTLDLMERKRVKIFGHMIAGCTDNINIESVGSEKQDQLQLITKITQSLGNCPKYMNQYDIRPVPVNSKLASQGPSLSDQAKTLILSSDMFFMTSSVAKDMDTNHRGGPAGFVRILSDTEIAYPEYSGNRLYQSLGNLLINPQLGITFPNYETGDVLYITGSTDILFGKDAAVLLPGSNLAVKIKIDEARYVEHGLPFRGTRKTPSPYNPLVRTLASEGNLKSSLSVVRKTGHLTKKTLLGPSVARFTFSVPEQIEYSPGQWVAFDFSEHLDIGYSHMREDDPRSLNDDFVRTFTISSTPLDKGPETEFDITIRNVGVVTSFLFRQSEHAAFEVPIVGVGGEFVIEQKKDKARLTQFIAGGVGITPLLGQIGRLDILPDRLRLLWTTRLTDIDLVLDIMRHYPDLARCTKVFFTGNASIDGSDDKIAQLRKDGVVVNQRRIQKDDVEMAEAGPYFLCAGGPLKTKLLGWLEGKDVSFENFDY